MKVCFNDNAKGGEDVCDTIVVHLTAADAAAQVGAARSSVTGPTATG
jgi:hypothetical protein